MRNVGTRLLVGYTDSNDGAVLVGQITIAIKNGSWVRKKLRMISDHDFKHYKDY